MPIKGRYKYVGGLAALILALDQITKAAVAASIPLWSSETVIPGFFNLVHIVNKGSAFGFLNRTDIQWQRPFFIVASLAAIGIILKLLATTPRGKVVAFTGLGLILGGALGNLIDRILTGNVVDFLDFYYGSYHWPAFNVADIGISMGALALIFSFYRSASHASRID